MYIPARKTQTAKQYGHLEQEKGDVRNVTSPTSAEHTINVKHETSQTKTNFIQLLDNKL